MWWHFPVSTMDLGLTNQLKPSFNLGFQTRVWDSSRHHPCFKHCFNAFSQWMDINGYRPNKKTCGDWSKSHHIYGSTFQTQNRCFSMMSRAEHPIWGGMQFPAWMYIPFIQMLLESPLITRWSGLADLLGTKNLGRVLLVDVSISI